MPTQQHSLRVVQIHTFYTRYIHAFYAAHQELRNASFAVHMRELIRDAFSATHMITPYLANCHAQLLIANCPQSQLAWAKEHNISVNTWNRETQDYIILQQIATLQPEVLYIGDTILYQHDFIKQLPYRPQIVLGWRGADVPLGTDWTGYDCMLSSLPRLLALATNLGAKRGYAFGPAMPKWIAHEVEDITPEVDVVFAGGISATQHVHRFALLEAVAQAASQQGFSLRLHLSCDPALITSDMRKYLAPPVFGLDMHRALKRGRIVVDCRGTVGLRHPNGSYVLDLGGDELCTMRQFEGTGGGSLLLTENLTGIQRYFTPGSEIAVYDSINHCIEQIHYYITHKELLQSISIAGKQRCLQEWNMQNMAKRFMDIVDNNLC